LTQPAHQQHGAAAAPFGQATLAPGPQQQLPLVYRMRGLEQQQPPVHAAGLATTISPQMYSTIDYVNVNQQRARQPAAGVYQQLGSLQYQRQQVAPPAGSGASLGRGAGQLQPQQRQLGIKLVCDIDQVFPVPEVSIYRLARRDGSHPEKLAKLDTRIERDVSTGLFHVQVTSIIDDDELTAIRQASGPYPPASSNSSATASAAGAGDEMYFECLIALTNLELSKYADNKRSIIYRPGE
jgi:hypothetical protein